MAITLNGTTGISSPGGDTSTSLSTTNLSYTGTLTGGTGIINIGSGQIYKDSSGNLGLGVTPNTWYSGYTALEFKNYGAITSRAASNSMEILTNAYRNASANYVYKQTGTAQILEMANGAYNFYIASSGTAATTFTPTQAMTLDASGKLLVGTTTAVSGYTIAIGDGTSATGIYAKCNGGGVVYAGVDPVNQASNGFYIGHLTATNQLQMRCGSTGGVYLSSGATSWAALSDERLKVDLKPIENAIQKVSTLRSVIGRYKTDIKGASRSFLIAQDVQSVFPEAVNAENPEELGVRYTDTIPLLVAAIKELSAQNNALEARLEALEAK